MKLKNIKTFEDFELYKNLGSLKQTKEEYSYDDEDVENDVQDEDDICPQCGRGDYSYERGCVDCDDEENEYRFDSEDEDEDDREWGDEGTKLERFSTFNEKKAKPDFLDLDKDGDKKESMKKAAADAKKDKKDKKEDSKKESGKGLTDKQKKLPEGLRKAIEKKNK